MMLIGCTSTPEREEKIFKINMKYGDPDTYNPRYLRDTKSLLMGNALFEGLTRINRERKVELALADKCIISKDKRTYTFKLRNTFWSNGEPLTSYDFEKSWKGIVKKGSTARSTRRFMLIKNAKDVFEGNLPLSKLGIRSIDEHTLQIELEHPAPYFLEMLSHPYFSPMKEDTKDLPTIFNGPFILKKWKKNDRLELRKNPRYWEKDKVKIDGVNIYTVEDTSSYFDMYNKGHLDTVGSPTSILDTPIMESEEVRKKLVTFPVRDMVWLMCNTEDSIVCSKDIRRALALSIDRKSICKNIKINHIYNKSILPKNCSYANTEKALPDISEDAINSLFEKGLRDIGKEKKNIKISLLYRTGCNEEKMAAFIKNRWENIFGIKIRLKKADGIDLVTKVSKKNYQLSIYNVSCIFNDPTSLLYRLRDSGLNDTGWVSEEFNMWFDKATFEKNEKKRKEYLKKAEELILDEVPIIPLCQQVNQCLIKPYIRGYFSSGSDIADFRWIKFKK